MSWSPTFANSYPRVGFWARQFGDFETDRQALFDVVLGVILPVIVLVVDPIVFQGGLFGDEPVLGRFQVFAYLFCALQMGLFLAWRTWRAQLRPIGGVLGGAFLAGAFFSFVMGIVLLPFSLIGLIVLIGAAGFTPFLTGLIYLRTGVRAIRAQQNGLTGRVRALVISAALVWAIGTPLALSQAYTGIVSQMVTELIYSEGTEAEQAVSRLRWMPVVPPTERKRIRDLYEREIHVDKKDLLRNYWKELTGEDINRRRAFFD
jgi:hypothetical protein